MDFPSNLQRKLQKRAIEGNLRSLRVRGDLIDFSSNDYLGFSRNTTIFEEVKRELSDLKPSIGSTGSRLLSGNTDFHEDLECQMASFFEAESALLFNSGYDANLGLLSSVPQRGDSIFYDEFVHASIRDGIRLSHARSYGFRHNDIQDLRQKILNTRSGGEIYVVVESLYSMDGDMAPLKELASMAGEQNLKLIVDEAHSTGIYGKRGQGMVIEQQLQHAVFARVHTFGKALGCHGATVVGSTALREFLINFSRPFIYTTSMPPYGVLTIKYVLRALEHTNQREILKGNIRQFRDMVNQYGLIHHFMDSSGPIQCLVLGSVERIMEISSKLRESNFDARAILSPTVPEGKERIRFCIHSYNTSREIQEILFLLSTFV